MKWIGWSVAALLLSASPAWADVISPEDEACQNAAKGDTCTYTNPYGDASAVKGTCEDSTCPEKVACPDAGSTGICTVQVACLVCKAPDGGASGSGSGSGGKGGNGGCDIAPGGAYSSFFALLVASIVPLALRRRRKAS